MLSAGLIAACACPASPASPVTTEPAPTGAPGSASGASGASGGPVTLAFAGDIHFAGVLASRLDDPASAIGPMRSVLASADLAVANLETAVTTRGTPQEKQFVFRAPPTAFDAIKDSGIDIVTMANNHGLDYGPVSVPDALDAAALAKVAVVGLGRDDQEAFAPYVATVRGRRIAVLGASAVVDDSLVSSWSAGRGHPGIATALDGRNEAIVAAVEAIRTEVDTVVVELHYGRDLTTCPTTIQRTLADDLVTAGADVVVGQHAHVLVGGGYHGRAYVDYGLGNFEFYVPDGSRTSETGVLTLTVDGRTVSDPTWHPGRIVGGLPTALTGAAAAEAVAHKDSLRACAGLTAQPSS